MLAGLMIPGRPVGNMYFAAWSHNVISNAVSLSNDLKMGEYCKFSTPTFKTWSNQYSENSPPCHVLDSNLGYYSRRLYQLRCDDFNRCKKQGGPQLGQWQQLLEWCHAASLQHQCNLLGPGFLPLQDGRRLLDGSHWYCYRCWCCYCSPHLLLCKYPKMEHL